MGKEGIGVKNDNGQRLADLRSENGLDNTQADLGVT